MIAIACITTCSLNLEYFKKCLDHFILSARNCQNLDVKAVILDFSNFQDKTIKKFLNNHPGQNWIHSYHKNPEYGLCKNLNQYIDIVKREKPKWAFYFNDDSFIHDQFIENAIMLGENNMDIGFVGEFHKEQGGMLI